MRIGYADPPYPGMSGYYKDHPDYGGEVDHAELVARLEADYDAWVLHTASTTLGGVLAHCPGNGERVGAWCKSWASFKPGVMVAFAWEPVIFKPGRSRPVDMPTVRDWIVCPITLKKGLTGAKPAPVVRWALELVGAQPDDELDDMFPGTGAVTEAWDGWRATPALPSLAFGEREEQTIAIEGLE